MTPFQGQAARTRHTWLCHHYYYYYLPVLFYGHIEEHVSPLTVGARDVDGVIALLPPRELGALKRVAVRFAEAEDNIT